MSDARTINARVETIEELLTAKFGVRRRALPRMLVRVGRRMPRRMHARAQVLIEAQKLAGHPRLARQMDDAAAARAFDALRAHLEAIDVAERRRGRLLGLAGVVVFNLLVVATAFVVWLWWRGYV